MSPGWIETYLGLIFQVYGLAFFVLGVAALLGMRRDSGTGLAAHLGWLAAFGMLHGLQEFIDGERLHNPAAWLVVLGTALMVASFAALLEFGRRLWNDRPGGRRLAALPLHAATGLGTVALLLAAPEAAAGLELGARYLLGAPGAALAGFGLLAQARGTARAPESVAIIYWMRVAALAMFGYAALTLFLSPGSGRLLAHGLPTAADFLATTGLPVQLARTVCAVLLAVGFVIIGQRIGSLTATSLRRVTDRLDGFVYRSRNDPNRTVSFMSGGGETLTGYPAADFLRGKRHFADQIHPDDRHRVWDEVQAALAARRVYRLRYRMLDRAGTVNWCYEEGRGVFDAQGELLYLEGLVRNDDARHQAEDARRRMQAMVEASPQAMGWADPDGTVRFFNAALRTLLAVPAGEEVSGYRLRDFYDDKAYEQIESTVLPAVAAQGAWIGEIELTALDGRRVPTLHSVFDLRDEAGGTAAFANVITDLSEIRAAQRDLHIKDTAIASATSAIALAGLDGALTYVNQAFVALWGLAGPEEALGRSALSFWDKPDQAQAVVDTLARTGRWQGELLGRRAGGSRLDVQLTGHMVLDHDGKPLCMMGSFLDVTARNQAQQALQRERDFAQSLLDTTPAIILLLDPQGMIRHANSYFEQLTGYRLDEIVGKEWFATFLPQRDQARIRELFAASLHDRPVRGNINPIVTRDGEERAIEWHAMPLRDAGGQMTGLLSIGMDVTERNKAELELAEKEVQLRAIVEGTFDGILMTDVETRKFSFGNPAICRMLGVTPQELLTLGMEDIHPPQALHELGRQFEAMGRTELMTVRPARLLRKDGEIRLVDISGSAVLVGGRKFNVGVFRDVTEQERSARANREQARLLDFIFKHSQDCMAVLDKDYNFVRVTDSYARAGGREASDFVGKNHFEVYPSDFKEAADDVRRSKLAYHKTERPFVYVDHPEWGVTYWDVDFVPVRDAADEIELFLLTIKDVTARRRQDEALKSERDRLRQILDSQFGFITVMTPEGAISEVNATPLDLAGLSREAVLGQRFWEVGWIEPAFEPQVRADIAAAARGETVRRDHVARFPGLGARDVDAAFSPIRETDGHISGVVGFGIDITERKQATTLLQRSEARLSEAQRIARVGSWELDLVSNHLHWSDEIFRLFELDPTQFGASYEAFLDAMHPDDRAAVNAAYAGSLRDRQPYRITHRLRMADGRVKHVQEQCETDFAPDGTPLFSRGTVQDVTERMLAEERIRQSLLEKETLLREIHHRVKNNLQVVASLLHFHAKKLHDAASVEVFAEVRAQLRSMTLVHEKLYRSSDLARIDFGDYLRTLVPEIANTRAEKTAVAVSVQAAEAWLPIETAMPCGLLVSELLTNALKHGFPHARRGRVEVALRIDAGALVLTVADDGVGLPEGFDPAGTGTFGWQLIHALAVQVGGTVDVARERGTVVRVVVSLAAEVPSS